MEGSKANEHGFLVWLVG